MSFNVRSSSACNIVILTHTCRSYRSQDQNLTIGDVILVLQLGDSVCDFVDRSGSWDVDGWFAFSHGASCPYSSWICQ
jgi:hypothetical protein